MKREKIDEKEMPFLDHLEELRWRLLKAMISIVAFTVIGLVFSDQLLDLMLYPGTRLDPPINIQVLKVQSVFMMKLEIALVTGVIVSLPVLIVQIWNFVSPGLLDKEKKYVPYVVIVTVFFFMLGVAFAYFIIIPFALKFFLGLAPEGIINNIALDFYIGFVLRLIIIFGIVFELPMVSLLLTRIGLLTPTFMRRYRKHAIIAAFVLGAILTPPDPSTQIMLAIPLALLYEVSIYVSYVFMPKRVRARLKQAD